MLPSGPPLPLLEIAMGADMCESTVGRREPLRVLLVPPVART